MSSKYKLSNGNYMGSATYMVTKKGFYNNMQWHLQDDHTYFGDYSRGYFLEIDGTRDNEPFYSTSLDGLCSGTELDFSAYVANITYAGQIPYLMDHYGYAYPRLRFVITDPTTGQQVASYSTGDILPDYTKVWDVNLSESADWQRVSMRFKVPDNVNSVTLSIFNDVTSDGTGNDFALDDIEVRLCIPPIGITGEDSVCMFRSTTLRAQSEYQQTATQIEYCWWHSTDSSQWSVISTGTSPSLTLPKVHAADSGWYKVAMAPTGNIESTNCRTESEPVRLHVTPVTACAPTIAIEGANSVCPSLPTELRAVSAYPAITGEPMECEWWHSTDSMHWTKIADATAASLSLDFVQAADSGWYKVAMATEGNINNPDYRIESEPYRLFVRSFKQCAPPVIIRSPHNVCAERHYRFSVLFDNNGMITEPIVYQWFYTSEFDPDLPPEMRVKFSSIIVSESERLTRLVNDLLTLQRIEHDDAQAQKLARVDLRKVAQNVVDTLHPILEERGANVAIVGEAPDVLGNADRLKEMLTNLVENASRFIEPGGHITIDLCGLHDNAVIQVKDDGAGFGDIDPNLLFSRFYRADTSRARNTGGTGLGLSIVKSIVEAHDGTIEAVNLPEGGANFIVAIPAID